MRTRSPLKARACSPLQARMCSPLMARTYSPLKVIGTSTQGSTFMRKQEIDSSRGPVIPNPQDLDTRCRKSMQLTWLLGMQTHATFVVKLGNADLIWNNAMQWKVVQCSWHSFPILWFWFWFNLFGKHRLTVLLKKVIIHATLSYLLQVSPGTPSECIFCLI